MRGVRCKHWYLEPSRKSEHSPKLPYHTCFWKQSPVCCRWLQRWTKNQSDRKVRPQGAKSLGNSKSKNKREHQLDLPWRLWSLPDLSRSHDNLWWIYNIRPEDKPLLPLQRSLQRNWTTKLQDKNAEQLLPTTAQERSRWQAILRRNQLSGPAHFQLENLRVGLHWSQVYRLVIEIYRFTLLLTNK